MYRLILLFVAGMMVAGCYRPPTDPAQIDRAGKPADSRPPAETDRAQSREASEADRAASTPSAEGPDVVIGSMVLTAPEHWTRKPPSSGFLITEFSLPKADEGTDNGRLTVSTAGGSVQANVDRWRDQFGGNPEPASQDNWDVAGLSVTVVDFSGTFNDQAGPFAPATPKPGYRMLAAIIPLDGSLFFLKAYGPQQTMALHEDAFREFVRSLKPRN